MAEKSNPPPPPPPEAAVTVTVTDVKPVPKEEKPKLTKIMKPIKSIKANHLVQAIALVTFVLSIPIIFMAIMQLFMQQYDCEGIIKELPKMQTGLSIGLLLLFVLSNAVVYMRTKMPAPGLIVVMVPLIVMLVVGFGLVGDFNMDSRRIPASPRWIKLKVHSNEYWRGIKTCIYGTRTCKDLIMSSYTLKSYDFSGMTSLESGCCQPPSVCEMEYVNATYWRKPNQAMVSDGMTYDRDCDMWQNDDTMLCYDCESCKEGFIKTLQGKWLRLGNFLIVMSLLLMISHLIMFVATMWGQHAG